MLLQGKIYEKFGNNGIKICKNYGKLPLVECYAGRLNQVFMNLFLNALDALEQKNQALDDSDYLPTLTITTEYIEPTENSKKLEQFPILIRIRDNGVGIDAEMKNQIFEPFFTTKTAGKGTGLGLAVSSQIIVDQHQGKLECQSVLGQGSEFTIYLPLSLIQ